MPALVAYYEPWWIQIIKALLIFAVGLQLRMPLTTKGWRVAAILASLSMVATIALATLAGWWLMPGLGLAGALLLAGILAPTDPVLASEVQIRSQNDRDAVRVSLTAEGGLNDGTALPVVMLALGLLGIGDLGPAGTRWMWHDFAWPIAGGVLLGWAFGRVLGKAIHALLRHGHGLCWDELLYLGIITVAYGLSRLTDTSSFLFVFAAALGLFRRTPRATDALERAGVEPDELADRLLAFGHRCGRLVEVVMVLLLGVLALTQEFRYGTATSTYLVEPRRTRVLVAKWLALALASVVLTAVTLALGSRRHRADPLPGRQCDRRRAALAGGWSRVRCHGGVQPDWSRGRRPRPQPDRRCRRGAGLDARRGTATDHDGAGVRPLDARRSDVRTTAARPGDQCRREAAGRPHRWPHPPRVHRRGRGLNPPAMRRQTKPGSHARAVTGNPVIRRPGQRHRHTLTLHTISNRPADQALRGVPSKTPPLDHDHSEGPSSSPPFLRRCSWSPSPLASRSDGRRRSPRRRRRQARTGRGPLAPAGC